MGYKALGALTNASLTIQSKVIKKILRKGTHHGDTLVRCNLMTKESTENLNHIYRFISLQSSEENAKRIIDCTIKLLSKLWVLIYNDLLTESEEDLFMALLIAERDFATYFLRSTGDDQDVSELVEKMNKIQEMACALLAERFSEKTVALAKEACSYFTEDVLRFLLQTEEASEYKAIAHRIMRDVINNHPMVVKFVTERRSQNKRTKKLYKISQKVQASAFSALEHQLELQSGTLKPSQEMITQSGMEILGGVQRFIELESKDEQKGEQLLTTIITLMANTEAAYKAEVFTEADEKELITLVRLARDVLEHYVTTANWIKETPDITPDITKLEELYDEAEEHLCNIIRAHFDGECLTGTKSLFYYFRKPEVNLFFFQELEGELKDKIVMLFEKLRNEIPVTFLTTA